MSQLQSVRNQLIALVQSVNAPLPAECRMLADGTILIRDTSERIYPAELNRRYLISILAGIDIPAPPDVKAKP